MEVTFSHDGTVGDVDAVVLPHFAGEGLGPIAQTLDGSLNGVLSELVASGEADTAFGEWMLVPTWGQISIPRVLLLGLGSHSQLDRYRLRNAYEMAGRHLKMVARRVGAAVEPSILSALDDDSLAVVRAIVSGLVRGNCEWDGSRRVPVRPGAIEGVRFAGFDEAGTTLADVAREAVVVSSAANECRVWQWQPANILTPEQMASDAFAMAESVGLDCTILGKTDLERLGAGLVLGVARGSHEPPCMVILRHRGRAEETSGTVLGLVGKGITFDSGGTSLKPATRMGLMKADMSGGGTVIAAMRALRELDAPISVIGVVPLTENMPGGSALKPGDILTALDGRSVEIINTDAEGRLVMADGLTYAAREGATHLVDVASLTGYVRMALGHTATGAMTNSRALLELVLSAAEAGGERIWEMPMYPEFDVCLDTEVADVKNLGSSDAGGISHAAVFLREFVGQVPWVHLDICGSFVNDEPSLRDILPDGPTGAMVDTLSHLPFLMDGLSS